MPRRSAVSRAGAAAAAMVITLTAAAPLSSSGTLSQSEWALTTLDAHRAWDISRGKGVTVAVIGSGIDASHPDLKGQVVRGADFGDRSSVDGRHDQGTETSQGTGVAGIIAATTRNFHGNGLHGLAPQVRLLPLRVYRNDRPAVTATAKAIRYAADHGARVINVSVSFTRADKALRSAVEYAVHTKDAVLVAGAGDNGAGNNATTYPAALPGVVAVSATNKKGAVWPGSHHGRNVTLAAPGVDILTTARNADYWSGNGTMYAAPWVSAGAALLYAEYPRWSSGQIVRKLIDTAEHRGSRGQDPRYGYGIVAPAKALADRATPPGSSSSSHAGREAERPGHDTEPAAARSSDTTGYLVVGVFLSALIVLTTISMFLISRSRNPQDDN